MKVIFGNVPAVRATTPMPSNLHPIQQPQNRQAVVISVLFGLLLALVPILAKMAVDFFFENRTTQSGFENIHFPLWAVPLLFLICVMAHEYLHLACYPDHGASDDSILAIWVNKLQFGVYFHGFMTKERWLLMRLLPVLCLTLLPAILLLLSGYVYYNFYLEASLTVLVLINGLGSGADLAASLIVAKQVPPRCKIGTWNGSACWESP